MIDKAVKGFPKVFGILDEAVKSGFYGSDSFSMADCFLLPILNSVQRYPEGKDAVESAANVIAYFNATASGQVSLKRHLDVDLQQGKDRYRN